MHDSSSIELEYAEKRMQQKWRDLVMEEQRGAALPVLERMLNAYMLAVEEYNHCVGQGQPQYIQQHKTTKKKAS